MGELIRDVVGIFWGGVINGFRIGATNLAKDFLLEFIEKQKERMD